MQIYEDMWPVRYNCVRCSERRFCGFNRSVRSASSVFDAKRVVVERKPIFRRFGRLRRSAIVSSRIGVTRLYRPTPTDYKIQKHNRQILLEAKQSSYMMYTGMSKWSFVISRWSWIEWKFFCMKISWFPWTSNCMSTGTRKIDIFRFETGIFDCQSIRWFLFESSKFTEFSLFRIFF